MIALSNQLNKENRFAAFSNLNIVCCMLRYYSLSIRSIIRTLKFHNASHMMILMAVCLLRYTILPSWHRKALQIPWRTIWLIRWQVQAKYQKNTSEFSAAMQRHRHYWWARRMVEAKAFLDILDNTHGIPWPIFGLIWLKTQYAHHEWLNLQKLINTCTSRGILQKHYQSDACNLNFWLQDGCCQFFSLLAAGRAARHSSFVIYIIIRESHLHLRQFESAYKNWAMHAFLLLFLHEQIEMIAGLIYMRSRKL